LEDLKVAIKVIDGDQIHNKFDELLKSFMPFAQKKLGYDKPVDVQLVSDPENAKDPLGKTAYYDPNLMRITIFVDKRHAKDIMRSLSHELVHHKQNCDGQLSNIKTGEGYAQTDPHLREMEIEAEDKTNTILFRDWEDQYKQGDRKMNENVQIDEALPAAAAAALSAVGGGVVKGLSAAAAMGKPALMAALAKALGTAGGVASKGLGPMITAYLGSKYGLEAFADWFMENHGNALASRSMGGAGWEGARKNPGQMVDQEGNPLNESILKEAVASAIRFVQQEQEEAVPQELPDHSSDMWVKLADQLRKDDNIPHQAHPQLVDIIVDKVKAVMGTSGGMMAEGDKKPDEDGDGVPDWADKKPGKNDKEELDEAIPAVVGKLAKKKKDDKEKSKKKSTNENWARAGKDKQLFEELLKNWCK
tara:strand:+ start:304 stop:1560 length:1257 start_codon:yes stop_codon:yes gene_type:complete